jgi:hypothetical protein
MTMMQPATFSPLLTFFACLLSKKFFHPNALKFLGVFLCREAGSFLTSLFPSQDKDMTMLCIDPKIHYALNNTTHLYFIWRHRISLQTLISILT